MELDSITRQDLNGIAYQLRDQVALRRASWAIKKVIRY